MRNLVLQECYAGRIACSGGADVLWLPVMMRFVRIACWVMSVPYVWGAGCLILSLSPAAYTVEREPLSCKPARPLCVKDVAGLNDRLATTGQRGAWCMVPAVAMYAVDEWRVLPDENGALVLVKVRPAPVWLTDCAANDVRRRAVLREWLAEVQQKGDGAW